MLFSKQNNPYKLGTAEYDLYKQMLEAEERAAEYQKRAAEYELCANKARREAQVLKEALRIK